MYTEIRPYRDADWGALCEVHDRARPDELRGSVDPGAFLPLAETAGPEGLFDGEVWVAEESGRAAGRVVGFVAFSDDEVTWLYVHPDQYRRGIGRRLLRHAVGRCGLTVTIESLSGNAPALALYESEGFEAVKTRIGHLTGNQSFPATGVVLELYKP